MAYKYQMGTAVMSGSLIQEGAINASSLDAGAGGITNAGAISGATTISGSSNLLVGGTVSLQGVADTALDVGADSFFYKDAGDDLMKRDSMADYATAIAGVGLGAASGVLLLDISEIGAGTVASGDKFLMLDSDNSTEQLESVDDLATFFAGTVGNSALAAASGVLGLDIANVTTASIASTDTILFNDQNGDVVRQEAIDDIASLFAGAGLAASSAVLAVNVSGAMVITSDNVCISGSIAGPGLNFAGPATAISGLDLDISEFSEVAPASNDAFLTLDSDNSTEQLCTVDALASLYSGAGLAATAAVIAVVNASDGGLAINANDMQLDLNDLAAAAVDVAADSVAIVDANDSNASRKESIADLVTAMAGTGLTATAGTLNLSSTGGVAGIGDAAATLAEGVNYGTTTLTANRVWTLPASAGMSVGDIVRAKAPPDVGVFKIVITRAGSQTIDGYTTGIELEADNAAISLIYAAADKWIII